MGELIFEWIFAGIYVAIRSLYDWLKEKMFGIKGSKKAELNKIEKKILYKKIRLTENLENGLNVGLIGSVLEIIDKENVFVEFYDLNGKQIEKNNEIVFKIKIDQFKLTK